MTRRERGNLLTAQALSWQEQLEELRICSRSFGCTVKQEYLPCDIKDVYNTMMNVSGEVGFTESSKEFQECCSDELANEEGF